MRPVVTLAFFWLRGVRDMYRNNTWRHALLHVAVLVAVELLILVIKLALGLPLL